MLVHTKMAAQQREKMREKRETLAVTTFGQLYDGMTALRVQEEDRRQNWAESVQARLHVTQENHFIQVCLCLVYVYVYVHFYVYLYLYDYLYLCVYVYFYVYFYVCVYVFV